MADSDDKAERHDVVEGVVPAAGPAAGKLTKRALIDAVATASEQKKPAVKSIVDAVLAELAAALARGDTLILPPLGRLTVARSKEAKGGEVKVLKLRQIRSGNSGGASTDDDEA